MRPLLISLAALVFLACDLGLPRLHIEHGPGSATVHLESLGEYPTSVGRLLLTDVQSGQTIWDARRSAGTPQLWKISFQAGENSAQPVGVVGGGSFDIAIPQEAPSFSLEPERKYRLTVWSEDRHSLRTINFKISTDPSRSALRPVD